MPVCTAARRFLLTSGLSHPACVVRCSIELTISYVYLSLHSYADRDNVGLPGFAAWFKDESDGERDHAQLLLNFQVGSTCGALSVSVPAQAQ
jgi:ferritin